MNKMHIIGNVVHTPKVAKTQSGVTVCNFSVAVRRRFKNQQTGNYDTDFFDVQCWRQLAELCEKFVEKGRKVAVVGSMQSREYEKDGVKKRIWELIADEVEFLTPKSEGAAQTQGAPATAQAAPQPQFTQVDDEELPF